MVIIHAILIVGCIPMAIFAFIAGSRENAGVPKGAGVLMAVGAILSISSGVRWFAGEFLPFEGNVGVMAGGWLLCLVGLGVFVVWEKFLKIIQAECSEVSKEPTSIEEIEKNVDNEIIQEKLAKKAAISRKLIVCAMGILLVSVVAVIGVSKHIEVENEKAEIREKTLAVAESYGLKDVNIIVGNKTEYGWYDMSLSCSNLADLSYNQMFSLSNDLDRAYISRWSYISNGDRYGILSSSRSIYVNGEEVYDDYWNSDSYQSASSRGSGAVCSWCGGDGRTHDWNSEGQICWKCGGDGWLSPDD